MKKARGRSRKTAASRQPPPEYAEDGVDLTLIRWMLSLTPGERLQALQSTLDSLARLRGASQKR